MHFCACPIHFKVHWREEAIGSCRLISPLIRSVIRKFSISSALWALSIMTQYVSNRSQYVMMDDCRSNWRRCITSAAGQCFGNLINGSICISRSYFPFWRISWSVMPRIHWEGSCDITSRYGSWVPLKVSEWCDFWAIKLNASKIKTIIASQVMYNACSVPSHHH